MEEDPSSKVFWIMEDGLWMSRMVKLLIDLSLSSNVFWMNGGWPVLPNTHVELMDSSLEAAVAGSSEVPRRQLGFA